MFLKSVWQRFRCGRGRSRSRTHRKLGRTITQDWLTYKTSEC